MGYFSNGSEGEDFKESYCYQCFNWRDVNDGRGEGCPIMDLHMMWNYDASNKTDAGTSKKTALNMFIPLDKDGWNKQCTMFFPKDVNP